MSNLNAPVSSKSTCINNAEYLYEQETPFGSITLFSKNTATFYESKDLSDLTPRAVNTLITLPEQMLCLWGYKRISSFLTVQVRKLPALLLEQFYVYKWSMTIIQKPNKNEAELRPCGVTDLQARDILLSHLFAICSILTIPVSSRMLLQLPQKEELVRSKVPVPYSHRECLYYEAGQRIEKAHHEMPFRL